MGPTHSLTIRLPEPVYKAAKKIAIREGVSLNRLISRALAEHARQSLERRLEAAYEELAADKSSDAEDLFAVQAEGLLDG